MTLPALSDNGQLPDDTRPYLYLETELRRLLRSAANPFMVAANPLAQALCEATNISDAQTALRATIERTFRGGFQERRLGEMLLRSIEGGELDAREAQISKRHLQRRRAKAVSMLAVHIGKVIGRAPVVSLDDDSAAADPLETIANLVARIEPETASQMPCLAGSPAVSNARTRAVRHRVDRGGPVEEGGEFARALAPALTEVLRAQSDEIAGRNADHPPVLWPLLARAEKSSAAMDEIRFELEWLNFLRAVHRGNVRQIGRIARNLQRLADDHASWVLRALHAQAETRMRCGRLEEATLSLDAADRQGRRSFALLDLACNTALRAELALQRGDHAAAERLATGAYLVLKRRHFFAYRCQVTIARARLRLSESWSCPDDVGDLAESAWDRIALNVELARQLFAESDFESSRERARAAFQISSARGYEALAARAASTIGATFDRSAEDRRIWCFRALELLIACRDRSVANDLFALDREGVSALFERESGEELASLLYDGLVRAIPHLRADSPAEREACRTFLQELGAHVLGSNRSLERSICALGDAPGAFAEFFVHFLDDASEVLYTTFWAIGTSNERSRTEYRLAAALRRIAAMLCPREDLRRFLVG